MYPTASALLDGVRGYADRFDPATLTDAQATEAVAVWTAVRNIAGVLVGLAAVRVDECRAWEAAGCTDGADWLARTTGISKGRARDQLQASARLADLDETAAAARAGRLSEQQVEAITDAAVAAPHTEQGLLEAARQESVGELRARAAKIKAGADPDPEATHARIHAARRLRRWTDPEGAAHLHAVGTPEALARLDTALAPLAEQFFQDARSGGVREPEDAYRFDALIALTDRATGDKTPRRRSRHLAVVRVDLEALVRGSLDGDETCEIAGLGFIPVPIARTLLGESILHLVLTKGTDVANVTYLGRGPTAGQRIALLWQMPECSRLGCHKRARLQIDHRHDWALTHRTRLGELDPLCGGDHDLKTHHGWALVDGTGKRPMVPPDHPDHPNNTAREPADAGPSPP